MHTKSSIQDMLPNRFKLQVLCDSIHCRIGGYFWVFPDPTSSGPLPVPGTGTGDEGDKGLVSKGGGLRRFDRLETLFRFRCLVLPKGFLSLKGSMFLKGSMLLKGRGLKRLDRFENPFRVLRFGGD